MSERDKGLLIDVQYALAQLREGTRTSCGRDAVRRLIDALERCADDEGAGTRLVRHLDSQPKAIFEALGVLKAHAALRSQELEAAHPGCPAASAYAGAALALDVLREFVPAW